MFRPNSCCAGSQQLDGRMSETRVVLAAIRQPLCLGQTSRLLLFEGWARTASGRLQGLRQARQKRRGGAACPDSECRRGAGQALRTLGVAFRSLPKGSIALARSSRINHYKYLALTDRLRPICERVPVCDFGAAASSVVLPSTLQPVPKPAAWQKPTPAQQLCLPQSALRPGKAWFFEATDDSRSDLLGSSLARVYGMPGYPLFLEIVQQN
jgi:hypothetical protein